MRFVPLSWSNSHRDFASFDGGAREMAPVALTHRAAVTARGI
jgi:hypothetical protein